MTTTLLVGGAVLSPAEPSATAMLVQDGLVGWVGSDALAAPAVPDVDHVVNLDGALVTPAFVDAHVHSTTTGLALTGLDLSGATSLADAMTDLRRFARGRAGTSILLGHGWDETAWPEGRAPTRDDLDRATGGAAVYLARVDVHSAVASSALLAALPQLPGLAGYSADGLLTTDAHHTARAATLAAVSPDERAAALTAMRHRCGQLGIGCVHELGGPDVSSAEDFAAVLAGATRDEPPGPTVVGYWGELGGVERARELGAAGAGGDLFVDGALGSRTARLRTVYADGTDTGHAYLTAAQVRDHVVACARAGIQAGFHVIGDGALETVLAGFGEAAAIAGPAAVRAGRHRLEHVEMPDEASLVRMSALGVHASVQPVFDARWGGPDGMYARRLGVRRAEAMNPFAAMSAAGIPLAFGSDSPVTPLGPWEAVRAAAFHRTPSSRLPVRVAFDAHTRGGWRAAGVDDAGTLVPGSPATYAVWARRDHELGPPHGPAGLPDLTPGQPAPRCLRTVVRGRTIWSDDSMEEAPA
jgi:predicted amidohydrolase YtcJ